MQRKVKVSFESTSPSSCFNILQLPARKTSGSISVVDSTKFQIFKLMVVEN